MTEQMVREWLTDYKKINKHELNSFASTTNENLDLIQVIFSVLDDKGKHQEFLDPVCHQFFNFYQSKNTTLQKFTLQFLPSFIWLYLNSVAHSDKKTFKQVEVLLLGIYNLVIVDSEGNPKINSYNIPSLSQPSIYHEPMNLQAAPLTENMLSKFEFGHIQKMSVGPFSHFDQINASNRLKIITVLLIVYNQNLSNVSKSSLQACCRMISRLCKHGFQRSSVQRYGTEGSSFNNPHSRIHPRIQVSAPFLLELLHAAYFTLFNGLTSVALQAIEDIKSRGFYEMLPDVMMVCNAIANSIKNNSSIQLNDFNLGVGVAMSPSPSSNSISKTVITNASFRTKKLPDDITIPNGKDDGSNEGKSTLMSISEDSEDSSHSKSRANSNVSKTKDKSSISILPNKKEKVKTKSKDQNSETSGSNLSLKLKKDEIVSSRTPKNERKKSESEFKVSSKYSKASSSDYILSSKFNDFKVDTQINVTDGGIEVGLVHRHDKGRRFENNNTRPHSVHSII